MNHVSDTELRSNLAKYLDEVCESGAALHVTRQNAKNVVLISEDAYEGLLETVHLLRSPANARRLLGALQEVESRSLVERDLIEPGPE